MAETLKQVLKAIKAYAAKHNQSYLEVRQTISINHKGEEVIKFEAYINGFGLYVSSPDIAGLIEQFDQSLTALPGEPNKLIIDDDLPF
ncbi:MAG: hypothetical protein JWQ09_5833 [Segetibacter sp.]|nr:hypothetical protein [Segetibacter sp.]